jgi:uncharacterized membrane protein
MGMSVSGMNAQYMARRSVRWAEVPGIYKARFKNLWHVLRLSLLAALVSLGALFLLPLIFGAALFSAHLVLTCIILAIAFLFSARLFWMSLKLAFNIRS